MKFQVHAAANETEFQHGAAPCRAFDSYQHWFRAEFRMSGNQHLALTASHDRVPTVLGLDLQNTLGREIAQKDATVDFRLNDVVVHLIAQVSMR